jgi:CubicO group peptidase (beta-lactamase class C family)
MKKVVLLLILLVLPGFVFGQDIDKILEQRLKEEPVGSAISVAVIDEKGTKFYNFGKTSKQKDASSADKNTVFEIGSITKVFTGILLAEAIRRGEVKLDDPISKYLPKTIPPLKYKDKEITFFDLTTHGSALPSLPDDFEPKDILNPYSDYTVDQMYAFLGRYKLTREIGSQFEYSNLGVGLLGHILALRANMSYEDLVKQRILKPLKMSHSAITFSPWMKSHLAPGHDASGKQTPNWDLPTLAGAGALRSNADDMAKFLAANLGISKTKLLSSLTDAQKLRKTYQTPAFKVGFNWITTKAVDIEIQWHNGGTGGYRTFAGMDHKNKRGVFVATNGSASVDDIGFHILDNKFALRKIEEPKTAITLSEEILEKYVGEYQISPNLSVVITREKDRLFGQLTKQPRLELFAEKEDEFFLKAVKADVKFTKDENGKVTGLVLYQGGGKTPARRIK